MDQEPRPPSPEIERRSHQETAEEFTVRAEHVIADYLADNPDDELMKMVKEKTINKERAYRILVQQARDPKTGVQRADILPYVLEYEMMLKREKGQNITIGYYDIDHFKAVNTELDHTGGDRVLRQAAEILSKNVRRDDVTRWGGEEFVIVYPNMSKEDALGLAERMRESFAEELRGLRPNNQPITISGGLVEYDPQRHANYGALLKEGSRTVLAAKEAGRNVILTEIPEAA